MKRLTIVDRGHGDAVVLVPGIQGRWEWMAACVDALAMGGRVVSCSLPGEPGSGCELPADAPFDVHTAWLDAALDAARLDSAVLCGVSYGGWVSVKYAAARPERVRALVLASAPGPGFEPDDRQQYYVRAPRLLLPAFLVTTRQRMRPEVERVFPDGRARRRFLRGQLALMARAPISPGLMARRIRVAMRADFEADARRVTAPTLVVTGEHELDLVVPVASTREYLDLIPGARGRVLERTGHLGCVTRPREFAELVRSVVGAAEAVAVATT